MEEDWPAEASSSLSPAMEAGKVGKQELAIDTRRHRWFLPFIGHMGICTSKGVIRDFAGPFFVSEDDMAFGRPTKYWQLNPGLQESDRREWDNAVHQASETYGGRMHNLCCDNCHSHVALALNLQLYDGSTNWNMIKLALYMLIYGRYVSWTAVVKTWLPFLVCVGLVLLLVFLIH